MAAYGVEFVSEDLKDLREQQAQLSRQMAVTASTKEEQLLVEVLQEHLGRLVTTADFKDCQMKFRCGNMDEYLFAHKGVDLGVVRREIKMDYDPRDFTKNVYSIQHIITFRKI